MCSSCNSRRSSLLVSAPMAEVIVAWSRTLTIPYAFVVAGQAQSFWMHHRWNSEIDFHNIFRACLPLKDVEKMSFVGLSCKNCCHGDAFSGFCGCVNLCGYSRGQRNGCPVVWNFVCPSVCKYLHFWILTQKRFDQLTSNFMHTLTLLTS